MISRLASCWAIFLLLCTRGLSEDTQPHFSPRMVEAPYCYVVGDERSWPILREKMSSSQNISLIARQGDRKLSEGTSLRFKGFIVTVDKTGTLTIVAPDDATSEFRLEVVLHEGDAVQESRVLSMRPAPPHRPISYVADLVDDLIRIFWKADSQEFLPLEQDGFDQYFRRLQMHGVKRLIVWQSPFPLIVDEANYASDDWTRAVRQAQAIIDSEELTALMRQSKGLKSYQWLRILMAARLSPDIGKMFTQSATDHGIHLTASFRPFEPALTKYYDIPVFNENGAYLWNFLPTASPIVNYQTKQVGFANGREVLRQMGRAEDAEPVTIEIKGVGNAEMIVQRSQNGERLIELLESPFPPLDDSSFVLVRDSEQDFSLQRYAAIHEIAVARLTPLENLQFQSKGTKLIISGLQVSPDTRYLIIRSTGDGSNEVTLPAILDVAVRTKAGHRLGRVNVYCALKGEEEDARSTRVAGIPEDGKYRTGFQAIENSIDVFRRTGKQSWTLAEGDLVVDLGDRWSVEMVDFERPAAREYVVKELKTILSHAAFDEIFINTRSHTQLASSTADGVDEIQPMAHYRLRGVNYSHNGIDRAFGPISMADDSVVRSLPTESITNWQAGEWQGACQTDDSPFKWRYHRNLAVASGLRMLLLELEHEFPETRIRVVIPSSEKVIDSMEESLDTMPKPDGGTYSRDYFRHIWASLNYIPAIGEGMAMVDLSGLSVEPVFLGVRFLPDDGPLQTFVNLCTQQLSTNCGSSYRGPRSFFYEAQETLRATDRDAARQRREEIICSLLSRADEINEVILYEAADWTYYLPTPVSGSTAYEFVEQCQETAPK